MKVAVIQFPGSNCDQDALFALRDDVGVRAEYVWYESTSLAGFDAVFLPGGFSYGDYLRCGAMAARAPIMEEVARCASNGQPVIGACNGFQMLCESQILPGALLLNKNQKFLCQDVYLKVQSKKSIWTEGVDQVLKIPIAHGEGRYVCNEDELKALEDNQQIAFRYCNELGEVNEAANPNGSASNVAGVLNRAGNVLGLMPHPERASNRILGCTDGLFILNGIKMVSSASY